MSAVLIPPDNSVNAFVKSMRAFAAPTILTLRHATDGERTIGAPPVRHENPFMWKQTTMMVRPDKRNGRR